MEDEKNTIEELKKQYLEFMNNKDFENALGFINTLIQLNPKTKEFYNIRGNLYADLGMYKEAEEDFDIATHLDDNFFQAYYNKATLFMEIKKYKEAKEIYSLLLSKINKETDAKLMYSIYINRGGIYFELENYQKAIEDFDNAIKIDKKIFNAYLNKGILYARLKEYKEAEDWILKIVDKDNYIIYSNLALIYKNWGKYKEAEEYFKKAKNINNEDFFTNENLALLYIDLLNDEKEEVDKVFNYFKDNSRYINAKTFEKFLFYLYNTNNKDKLLLLKKIFFELENNNLYIKLLKINNENIENKIFELYIISEQILFLNKFEFKSDRQKLAHYTSQKSIISIFNDINNKLRLKNSIYANDPEEGAIFKEIIGFEYNNKNEDIREEYIKSNIYFNCFSTNIDEDSSLPMWVNYGNQANGCAIIFNNNFFEIYKETLGYTRSNNDKILDKSIKRNEDLSYVELYKVVYLEKNKNNQYEIKDESIRKKVDEFKEIYKLILDEIKKLDNEQQNTINEILYDIIQYPSFIFKAKHFEYEQEVRIIKRFDINDKRIKQDDKDIPELYVELDKPIICEEVILGAKCENKEAMATFLYNKGVKKVTQSKLKYK